MPVKPIPEGYPRDSPYFIVEDVAATMEFIKYVFGAKVKERMTSPVGTVIHGEVSIGDSIIMLGKASENYPPQNAKLYNYVEETDAT